MRGSFPTREQLGAMTIKQLRNVDIREGDEEAVVQEILNQKVRVAPLEMTINFGTDKTDIKTVEQEAEMQEVIDARVKDARERLSGAMLEPEQTPTSSPEEVPPAPVEIGDAPLPDPTVIAEAPFCDSCDSKGGRHKKDCPKFK